MKIIPPEIHHCLCVPASIPALPPTHFWFLVHYTCSYDSFLSLTFCYPLISFRKSFRKVSIPFVLSRHCFISSTCQLCPSILEKQRF